MRIKNLQRILEQNDFGTLKGYLIYGNLEGAIQFHIDSLTRKAQSLGFEIHNASTLADIDTGSEPSLFGNTTSKKLTIVRGLTGRDFEGIQKALTLAESSHLIIFVGGNLGSKIKLVQHFQSETTLGALACYELSTDLIRSVLMTELASHNISLTPEQIKILVETYAGSPVSLFSDIEKISLYMGDDAFIETTALLDLVNGATRLNVDQMIAGFLRRDKKTIIMNAAPELLEAEPYLILRSLSRHIQQFCDFMAHFKTTNNPSLALQNMTMPISFQTKSLFQEASSLWSEKLVALALRHVLELELRFKRGDLSLQQFQAGLCLFSR